MSEKDEALKRLQEASFAIDDVKIYLDTHPLDRRALEYYEKQKELREKYMKEYVKKYGPISAYDVDTNNRWTWIDNPWPWETEAN
ncbi:MAG: spore coat protein CotJB [Clostridia bacterium]|nr:spore coat protein CotJB [Clostridia bacterium]